MKEWWKIIESNYKSLETSFLAFYNSFSSVRSFLKFILEAISSRKFIFGFLGILLLITLKTPYENFIDSQLRKEIFSEIKDVAFVDYLITILWIVIGYDVLVKRASNFYRSSLTQVYLLSILLFVYSYYRFVYVKWDFFSFSFIDQAAYLDFLFIYLAYPLAFAVWFHIKRFAFHHSSDLLAEDVPIKTKEDDALQRGPFAKNIASIVSGQKFENSFAVGIVGPWGSGKSSFMGLIREEISHYDNPSLIIDFNAFYNHDARDIINEFFSSLSSSIEPFSGKLSRRIEQYRDQLIDLFKKDGSKWLKEITKLIDTEQASSIMTKYQSIRKALADLNRQIIVFIDDVDRLRGIEIIEILKLIRNTGDFPNTVYFVAFDKDYVNKSLSNHTEYKDEKYIQKYFQYEFVLPTVEKSQLRIHFLRLLTDKLDERTNSKMGSIELASDDFVKSLFDSQMATLRDVTRLANTFYVDYLSVKGEVDIYDFINLMILKTKYTSAYHLLAGNFEEFVDFRNSPEIDGKSNTYVLKKNDAGDSLLIGELKKLPNQLPNNDLDKIEKVLNELFGYDNTVQPKISHLSIRLRQNRDKYFNLRLMSGHISEKEFLANFKSENFEEFKRILDKWISNHQFTNIVERIKVEPVASFDDIKAALRTLFYLGIHADRMGNALILNEIGSIVDFDLFASKGIIESKKEIGDFIEELLNAAEPPYTFESRFIRELASKTSSDELPFWGIERESLETIQHSYFTKHLGSLEELDWDIYALYHSAKDLGIDAVDAEFKAHLTNKEYKTFLWNIVDPDIEDIYGVSDIVPRLFGDYPNFNSFLTELEGSKELDEFSKFYTILGFYGYQTKVYFDFKVLPVRKSHGFVRESVIELYLEVIDESMFEQIRIFSEELNKESIDQNGRFHIRTDLPNGPNIAVIRLYGTTNEEAFKKFIDKTLKELVNEVLNNFQWITRYSLKGNSSQVELVESEKGPVIKIFHYQMRK